MVGTGANGASIAADLVRAGHDVTLIEQWPAHVEAMRRRGVRIELPDAVLEVPVAAYHLCEVAEMRHRFDVVFVMVKAYDTRWACELIRPYVAGDGVVVGVQNGMTTETVSGVMGEARTLGAVIEISSTMFEPGVVQRHSGPDRSWFALGAPDDAAAGHLDAVAALLGASGTVEVVHDIRAAKWMKLVSNCTTLVTTAILGLPMAGAEQRPGMRQLMLRAGQEALDLGRAMDLPPLPIFGLGPEDLEDHDAIVETLLDTLFGGFILPHTTTTVLQDWMKGRRSEVDELNGQVVRESERLGRDAPVNAAIVEVAHRIERGELVPAVENLDYLLAER